MRHRVAGKAFHRNANHRKALLRNLVSSLFDHLKIETTVAKAKGNQKNSRTINYFGKEGRPSVKKTGSVPNP